MLFFNRSQLCRRGRNPEGHKLKACETFVKPRSLELMALPFLAALWEIRALRFSFISFRKCFFLLFHKFVSFTHQADRLSQGAYLSIVPKPPTAPCQFRFT